MAVTEPASVRSASTMLKPRHRVAPTSVSVSAVSLAVACSSARNGSSPRLRLPTAGPLPHAVQHRRDHAIPVDRHPDAAGCAVTSANAPERPGHGRLWIPRAIDAFVTIGGEQDRSGRTTTNNCAHGRQHGLGRYEARGRSRSPNRRRLAHREQAARRLQSITGSYGRHPKCHPTAKDAARRGT